MSAQYQTMDPSIIFIVVGVILGNVMFVIIPSVDNVGLPQAVGDSTVSTLLHRRDVTHTPIHIHASVARGRAVQTDWEASATSLAVSVALLCSRATVWGGGL